MSPSAPRTAAPTTGEAPGNDKCSVRDKLLQAAVELVQSQGLQAVTQARVAASAGMRQSHLTYYFPTRLDLIKAIISALKDLNFQAKVQSLQSGPGKANPLAVLRQFFIDDVQNRKRARVMGALMDVVVEYPSFRDWLQDFDNEVIAHTLHVFAEAGVPLSRSEAALFNACFVGAAVISSHIGSEAALQQAADLVGTAFDRAVRSAQGH